MGMQLALDGKVIAVTANTFGGSFYPGTTYVALMSSYPANADGLNLTQLLAYEFTPSADWYTGGRKVGAFDPTPTYGDGTGGHNPEDGVGAYNTNTLTWSNTSGASVEVFGLFVCNVQVGDVGLVYWIGTPDVGTMTIENGSQLDIFPGGLLLGVD